MCYLFLPGFLSILTGSARMMTDRIRYVIGLAVLALGEALFAVPFVLRSHLVPIARDRSVQLWEGVVVAALPLDCRKWPKGL
jgi:hypothetical protein